MKIITLSDIHGNLDALQAVMAEVEHEKPDMIVCLGDLVGYGAYPNEVIAMLTGREIPTIMGNYDDGVGYDRDDCGCAYKSDEQKQMGNLSLLWTRKQVTDVNKAKLRSLLPALRLQLGDKAVLFVHGSPRRINEYVYADRQLASLERIATSAQADILVFGHTHLPYVKQVGSTLLVNDGSTGKPKDGDPRAAYAVLEIGTEIQASIKRVPYDVKAAAEAVRASGLPEHYADALENATG